MFKINEIMVSSVCAKIKIMKCINRKVVHKVLPHLKWWGKNVCMDRAGANGQRGLTHDLPKVQE